jgi:bacteriocin-like protein
MKKNHEIMSFNKTVSKITALIELDESELAQVDGGSCPNLSSCNAYIGSCSSLTSCGTYALH